MTKLTKKAKRINLDYNLTILNSSAHSWTFRVIYLPVYALLPNFQPSASHMISSLQRFGLVCRQIECELS